MDTAEWALAVSCLSLGVAVTSAAWGIYRDWRSTRPRIVLKIGIAAIHPGNSVHVLVTAANRGPGKAVLTGMYLKTGKPQGKLTHAIVTHPADRDPSSAIFPTTLDQADKVHYIFPFRHDCFLSALPVKAWIADSLGRSHSIDRGELKRAVGTFKESFVKGG